jgi:hypothetical protein
VSRAFVLGSVLAVGCAASRRPALHVDKTPVEVWGGGDEALTNKFRDALEAAFAKSPVFANSYGKKPGTLIVTIPSAVGWRDVGQRTRIFYRVVYSDIAGRSLGKATGKCWEDEIAKCTGHVVKRAEAMAGQMGRSK